MGWRREKRITLKVRGQSRRPKWAWAWAKGTHFLCWDQRGRTAGRVTGGLCARSVMVSCFYVFGHYFSVSWEKEGENLNIRVELTVINLGVRGSDTPHNWKAVCNFWLPAVAIGNVCTFIPVVCLTCTELGFRFCYIACAGEEETPTSVSFDRLLDVLAARKDPHGLTGDVLINGSPQPANFKCNSGYVVQVSIPGLAFLYGQASWLLVGCASSRS